MNSSVADWQKFCFQILIKANFDENIRRRCNGVIGRALVPRLVEAGHDVIGTARQNNGPSQLKEQGARGIPLDVLDRGAVKNALVAITPEVVMHQSTALSNVNLVENALLRSVGTRNLVDAAHASGVRTFVAQSIAWAYEADNEPAIETTPLDLTTGGSRVITVLGVRSLGGYEWRLEIKATLLEVESARRCQ